MIALQNLYTDRINLITAGDRRMAEDYHVGHYEPGFVGTYIGYDPYNTRDDLFAHVQTKRRYITADFAKLEARATDPFAKNFYR